MNPRQQHVQSDHASLNPYSFQGTLDALPNEHVQLLQPSYSNEGGAGGYHQTLDRDPHRSAFYPYGGQQYMRPPVALPQQYHQASWWVDQHGAVSPNQPNHHQEVVTYNFFPSEPEGLSSMVSEPTSLQQESSERMSRKEEMMALEVLRSLPGPFTDAEIFKIWKQYWENVKNSFRNDRAALLANAVTPEEKQQILSPKKFHARQRYKAFRKLAEWLGYSYTAVKDISGRHPSAGPTFVKRVYSNVLVEKKRLQDLKDKGIISEVPCVHMLRNYPRHRKSRRSMGLAESSQMGSSSSIPDPSYEDVYEDEDEDEEDENEEAEREEEGGDDILPPYQQHHGGSTNEPHASNPLFTYPFQSGFVARSLGAHSSDGRNLYRHSDQANPGQPVQSWYNYNMQLPYHSYFPPQ